MKTIANDVENTSKELLDAIAAIPKEQFDAVPFEGSWTAGQVAEHVLKSCSGISAILKGSAKPTTRDPEENVDQLRSIFLNFEVKYKSPESILPSADKHDRQSLSDQLASNFVNAAALANTTDLSATCQHFELPGFSELTKLEFLSFIVFHTQRHIHQLKNIRNYLE